MTKNIFVFLAIAAAAGFLGVIIGHLETNRLWTSASIAEHIMSIRIYNDIKKEFGTIQSDDPKYKDIKGSIHIYKDIDLAILEERGVKTIRVYQ